MMTLSTAQRGQIASQLSVSEEHLTGLLTHMQHIPPGAMMALLQFSARRPGGAPGGAPTGGGGRPQVQITLTAAEKASVDRVRV